MFMLFFFLVSMNNSQFTNETFTRKMSNPVSLHTTQEVYKTLQICLAQQLNAAS